MLRQSKAARKAPTASSVNKKTKPSSHSKRKIATAVPKRRPTVPTRKPSPHHLSQKQISTLPTPPSSFQFNQPSSLSFLKSTTTHHKNTPKASLLTPKSFISECNSLLSSLLSPHPSFLKSKRHFSTTTTPVTPQPPQDTAPVAPTTPEQPTTTTTTTEQQSTEQPTTDATSTGEQPAASTATEQSSNPTQAKYTQFRRAVPKAKPTYTPTESYFDENSDECLVIYEADDATIQHNLRERIRSLTNALLLGPVCAVTSYMTIPSPYSGIMIALSALFMLVNAGRIYSIHSFVTKITAVWPDERSDVSNKMHQNLNEALLGLTPLPGESYDDDDNNNPNEYETEFQARQKHNAFIAKERQDAYGEHLKKKAADELKENGAQQDGPVQGETTIAVPPTDSTTTTTQPTDQTATTTTAPVTDDATTTTAEASSTTTPQPKQPKVHKPIFPQPGVDPMGRVFSFNLNAPDPLTWKFGWSDMTQRASPDDVKSGSFPLFDRASFPDQVRAWSELPDPDFPEFIYIDRLNNGKTPIFQKIPLSSIASVWSVPAVPPSIPQITPKLIDQLQTRPHDQMVIMMRTQSNVSGLFPKFVKHDVAMNQLIFGSTINARSECKGKFDGIRGRLKI